MSTRGYLTAAYGHKVYLEQALCLLFSFRIKNDQTPFSIVLDPQLTDLCNHLGYNHWFDQIITLGNDKLHHFEGKLHAALQTPYTDTIYFDSDCILIKDWQIVQNEFSMADFCVPGGIYTSGTYAKIDIPSWLNHNKISYLPVFNAGVFRYNSQGIKIVHQALDIMHNHLQYKLPQADGGLNEQVALGIAMAQNNVMPLSYYNDLHFSFFNANSSLKLDIQKGICTFKKEGIIRNPLIFHYTPLYRAGFYYSRSNRILITELNKLRAKFNISPIEFFKPTLRDKLALIRRGKFIFDRR